MSAASDRHPAGAVIVWTRAAQIVEEAFGQPIIDHFGSGASQHIVGSTPGVCAADPFALCDFGSAAFSGLGGFFLFHGGCRAAFGQIYLTLGGLSRCGPFAHQIAEPGMTDRIAVPTQP
ncbi:MAG: hypothetical protein V7703_05660 [Hyphomicrobiales bacterium]